MKEMTESILVDHLRKAYELYGKASKLISVDRAARRIQRELNELINALEEYTIRNMEYDQAEVGTKLAYYEKQLSLIEEKKDSLLLRSFRRMSKPGSLQNSEVIDEEKYAIQWMKEKGYEMCYYSKAEALQKLDELKEGEVIEEEDPLGSGLDLWCLKVSRE